MIYKNILRPFLFRMDAERVHNTATAIGAFLGRYSLSRTFLSRIFSCKNKLLETEVAGIRFRNPIGLAAGFDKNAKLTQILPSIGFGFEEVGSITGEPCAGNPKPRLFRLPKDRSLAVNYGLCSEGAEIISKSLESKKLSFPVGISIARANNTDIVQNLNLGINDYLKAYSLLKDIGDYITINISCPNTPDNMAFSTPKNFDRLMTAFANIQTSKPVFIKLKPDFSKGEIDKFLAIAAKHRFITGFIISNLTKDKTDLRSSLADIAKIKGNLSGLPTKNKSTELIRYVYKKTNGKYVIIGCGGIFSAEDAYEKIKAGASLVQLITGMVYNGPGFIKQLNKGLVKLLERDGYTSIGQAVGSEA